MRQKPLLRGAACIFCFLLVPACNNLQNESSHDDSLVKASKKVSFSYSAQNSVYEVGEDTVSVQLTGDLSGKHLYLVKANPTDGVIASDRVRYVTALNNVPLTGSSQASARSVSSKRFFDDDIITYFDPPQVFDPAEAVPSAARSAVAAAGGEEAVSAKTFAVGDTRQLYVDANAAISAFEQKTAVLKAVGEYCYVWVVDVERNRAAELYAGEFQRQFDDMYRMITHVYGQESNQIYVYNGKNFSLDDMSKYSLTGTKVNIVLSRFVSTGTVGYFYCKDYYSGYTSSASDARAYSNQGKYVYINTRYVGLESDRKMAYSTLAHEFQHLIMFGQKNIRCKATAADWFNEMMSMVCEDMMQRTLGVTDAQSPKNRLGRFAASYYLSGASEFISVDGSHLPSYAVLYAFGAYLARTYGGAAFISKVMQNDYCNEGAIAAAVSEVTGVQTTFAEILRAFVLSFVKDGAASLNSQPEESPFFTGMVDSETKYDYPLEPIDMNTILQKGSNGIFGMKYFDAGEREIALRPNGFTLHSLGELSGTSLTVTFNEAGAAGQRLFLVVAE